MRERKWKYRETELSIKASNENAIDAAIEASIEARQLIERFIVRHPEFRNSLEPIEIKEQDIPPVIETMLKASEKVGIGPFAAVAGTISQIAAEAAIEYGAKNVIVNNGGDIAIIGNREFRVGIHAGDSPITKNFALQINPSELPVGICTSSGSVGHSISFGDADAVVVVANQAPVADAAATLIANVVTGGDAWLSIKRGLDKARRVKCIRGAIIVRGPHVGAWGNLPKIVGTSPDDEGIYAISKKYQSYGLESTSISPYL